MSDILAEVSKWLDAEIILSPEFLFEDIISLVKENFTRKLSWELLPNEETEKAPCTSRE